ncbi:MAG TPA: hypothetical protein VHB69_01230 [Mycobacteriales bacterium]|nr:hypothetical protein [Mycobacteriales bacterium]
MSARRSAVALALAALGFAVAGCSSGSSPSASPSSPAVASSPSTVQTVPPGPVVPSSPSLSLADIADPGLASHIGDGKLTVAQVRQLMQFFENKVSAAYAHGDADALDHYLAGPMLSGNRATINLLNSQNKLNVYRIRVGKVTIETNEKTSVIFDMTGDMVLDYFLDSKTHKVLEHGLPGPSQVQFAVFFNENPKNHTWYWTGEKSETASDSSGAGQ